MSKRKPQNAAQTNVAQAAKRDLLEWEYPPTRGESAVDYLARIKEHVRGTFNRISTRGIVVTDATKTARFTPKQVLEAFGLDEFHSYEDPLDGETACQYLERCCPENYLLDASGVVEWLVQMLCCNDASDGGEEALLATIEALTAVHTALFCK